MKPIQLVGTILFLTAAAWGGFAWADERVEVVTYVPSTTNGNFDRVHARRATVGTPYSLTNPTDANLTNGTLLVSNRVGINLGAIPTIGQLYVRGPDDRSGIVTLMPVGATPPLGDTDMRLGIGTTTPGMPLDIYNPTDAAFMRIWGASDNDTFCAIDLRSEEGPAGPAGDKVWQLAHKQGNGAGELNDFHINHFDGTSWTTKLAIKSTGRVGIGLPDLDQVARSMLSVYGGNASTTQGNFTQGLSSGGLNVMTNYTAGAYTPGLFWSTWDDNATKPKAGIYLLETATGTRMYLGTSNLYTTGITNDALVINENGRLGIGTITPQAQLHLHAGGDTGNLRISGAGDGNTFALIELRSASKIWQVGHKDPTNDLWFSYNDGVSWGTPPMVITGSTKRVGIGTTSPSVGLEITEDSPKKPTGGPWVGSSDIRLKQNVAPLTGALERILQLRGVTFQWKDPEKYAPGRQMGFIGQQIEAVIPEWVKTGEDGYKYTFLGRFEALTVEAVRELKAENDVLKKRVDILEEELKELHGGK